MIQTVAPTGIPVANAHCRRKATAASGDGRSRGLRASPLTATFAVGLIGALAGGLVCGLAGCASAPLDEESERLDSNTGTTVTLMPKPVELIVDRAKGPKTDPFAYLAPFETNRMGTHEMYLWVSAPQVAGKLSDPQVFCGPQRLELDPIEPDMKALGISEAPYKMPAPWSVQWFYRLSGEVLDCLATAKQLKIITQAGDEAPDNYVAESPALTDLPTFAGKVKT